MKTKIILICGIILLTGCTQKVEDHTQKIEDKPEIKLEKEKWQLVTIPECSKDLTEYYEIDERKVYLASIEDILDIDSKKSLKVFLNEGISIDKVITELIQNTKLEGLEKDGGTKIYKNDSRTVILCHRMSNYDTEYINQDIYIGNEKLEIGTNFCEDSN